MNCIEIDRRGAIPTEEGRGSLWEFCLQPFWIKGSFRVWLNSYPVSNVKLHSDSNQYQVLMVYLYLYLCSGFNVCGRNKLRLAKHFIVTLEQVLVFKLLLKKKKNVFNVIVNQLHFIINWTWKWKSKNMDTSLLQVFIRRYEIVVKGFVLSRITRRSNNSPWVRYPTRDVCLLSNYNIIRKWPKFKQENVF